MCFNNSSLNLFLKALKLEPWALLTGCLSYVGGSTQIGRYMTQPSSFGLWNYKSIPLYYFIFMKSYVVVICDENDTLWEIWICSYSCAFILLCICGHPLLFPSLLQILWSLASLEYKLTSHMLLALRYANLCMCVCFSPNQFLQHLIVNPISYLAFVCFIDSLFLCSLGFIWAFLKLKYDPPNEIDVHSSSCAHSLFGPWIIIMFSPLNVKTISKLNIKKQIEMVHLDI